MVDTVIGWMKWVNGRCPLTQPENIPVIVSKEY